ncbi:MAG: YecH family protein [Deltaproteobacteria bacterium]|nr:YecH family protein [Deltaproteobacteria bacterium]
MAKMIHGHEVLQMMIDSQGTFNRETLEAAIIGRFGEDARFFTCSAEGMTAAQLIDFLDAKGKFESRDEGFNTTPDRICDH